MITIFLNEFKWIKLPWNRIHETSSKVSDGSHAGTLEQSNAQKEQNEKINNNNQKNKRVNEQTRNEVV